MSWSFTLTSTCTQKLSSPHKDVCETTAAHELFFSATNLMFSGIVNIECPPYVLRWEEWSDSFFLLLFRRMEEEEIRNLCREPGHDIRDNLGVM